MNRSRIWDRCINHRGAETQRFVADYFTDDKRRITLIAGIGFDPRSTRVCELLSSVASGRLKALFIREERPDPSRDLVKHADLNSRQLIALAPDFREASDNIFATD